MTSPAERAFAFFARGELRDEELRQFRIGLRLLTNPETGNPFTEDELARATQKGSRWWIESDAVDLVAGMATQSRALLMADQVRIDRANSNYLVNYHGALWGIGDPLPASPGSGLVATPATVGTTYLGSTLIPDPAATTFRDEAGLLYQVLTTVVTPGSGIAELTLVGVDTGEETNLETGASLTIDQNIPIGASPTATVASTFTGGLPLETNDAYRSRVAAQPRHKAGSGNDAHFRSWGRDASNAVLDVYVYGCAMHAGTVLIYITQKRGSSVGPNGLRASDATLAAATGYLVPPSSPVVPTRPFIVVTRGNEAPSDSIVQLAQGKGNAAGWADVSPFPGFATVQASIDSLVNQTHFTLISDAALPNGATTLSGGDVPHLMVWDDATSRFVELRLSSITFSGMSGPRYLHAVVLTTAPSKTLAVGDWISPDMARRTTVSVAAEQYFDELGPGEVVDLTTDTRADTASRFPDPSEEAPSRGGQAIITAISDALGATLAQGTLYSMSVTTPPLPADVVTGPSKLTLGKFAVYDLP